MSKVTIYTTQTCQFCKMAKMYFKDNNVEYIEKDVTTNAALQQEMIEKSGQMGVPVIIVGDQVVVGFDKPRLQELITAV
ncbi:MAG: glutaredoxin family protein [Candidatus Doudnabacteria bacterium]|nr:glutaredoxin family protein [Candidatus Doudnabacteria bacterium]